MDEKVERSSQEEMRNVNGNYEVGYGKPPKDSQFKPGQSGNPNGRPKGMPIPGRTFFDSLQEPVVVTVNGKRQKLSISAALHKKVAQKILEGDKQILKLALTLESKQFQARRERMDRIAAALEEEDMKMQAYIEAALITHERIKRQPIFGVLRMSEADQQRYELAKDLAKMQIEEEEKQKKAAEEAKQKQKAERETKASSGSKPNS